MPLKLRCPHCGHPIRLSEPYPRPGAEQLCPNCQQGMAIAYPDGVMERLQSRGKRFVGDPPKARRPATTGADTRDGGIPRAPAPPLPGTGLDFGPPRAAKTPPKAAASEPAPAPRPPVPPQPADDEKKVVDDVAQQARQAEQEALRRAAELARARERAAEEEAERKAAAEQAAHSVQVEEAARLRAAQEAAAQAARKAGAEAAAKKAAAEEAAKKAAKKAAAEEAAKKAAAEEAARKAAATEAAKKAAAEEAARKAAAEEAARKAAATEAAKKAAATEAAKKAAAEEAARKAAARKATPPQAAPEAPAQPPAPPRKRSFLRTTSRVALGLALVGAVGAAAGWGWIQATYGKDLPSIDTLRSYRPATVTTVLSSDGELIGEIYEQRRYVLEYDEIPEIVRQAFVSAEDANFYDHGGIDFMGIARAMGRNLKAGRVSQGGSTITQQVAKNFLLSNDRKLERKIKEALLSWRIEKAYTKEHILYLYLNEIFLGSQAYGVEAASRAFFGKNASELTLGEAAMIAGLPPRPSPWNPHRHFDAAKNRQKYVLGQMVRNGYITQAQADEAEAQEIVVTPLSNTFREQAPHCTEAARRYLVETYGEERVLNDGLTVVSTCNLDLQKRAQAAVAKGVNRVDQRMGFRRDAITHLDGKAAIDAHAAKVEADLKAAWAYDQDPAGRVAEPAKSVLKPGELYEGVITEVSKKYARVRIGAHEGIIPVEWSKWVYEPNPRRSWKSRVTRDLTEKNSDGVQILQAGDVVPVRLEAMSTTDEEVAKDFRGTPGESGELLAVRLWQTPEVEAALLSIDVATGAVRAMVGSADFERSEFNRALQSVRQVGSTFKPIVYAAALETKKITAASLFADAPLAFETSQDDFIWKPGNYGGDYMGNITLRKALALSRNTSTVRVLESVDPGMNDDVVYDFARRLGIGGPATHTLPEDHVTTPDNDHLCPWVEESRDSTICLDRFPAKDPNLSDRAHRAQLGPDDDYQCRACDLSLGLGSASLTMEELVRAYAVFANGGKWTVPYYVDEVRDRDGKILERHQMPEPVQIIDPSLADLATWLLRGVVEGGTATQARRDLGITLAGKTGTTNDFKDAWFVGFSPTVLTSVWVGFDQPASLGVSSTGGKTALPIFVDYMKYAAPKSDSRNTSDFPRHGDLSWVQIDEATGRRVKSGGRSYPFLPGTVPEATGTTAGEASLQDLTTEL